MVASLKSPAKETWRGHFKRFLSFYENDFEDLCLLSLDGELSLDSELSVFTIIR